MRDKYTNATFLFGDATDAHLFIARNQQTFGNHYMTVSTDYVMNKANVLIRRFDHLVWW